MNIINKSFIAIVAIFTLVSCNGNSKQTSDTNTDQQAKITTTDREIDGLKGDVINVKSFRQNCDENGNLIADSEEYKEEDISYSEKGENINYIENYTIYRDEQNRIISLTCENDSSYFTYNTKGQIESVYNMFFGEISGNSTHEYTYNEDGDITNVKSKGISDGMLYNNTTTYTYKDKDTKGNWTKAFRTNTEEFDEDGEISTYVRYDIVRREIQYK